MAGNKSISRQALERLPVYLNYMKSLPLNGPANISATSIAEALHLNDVQVRKDLSAVSSSGRPKVGYIIDELIAEIERFLGYNEADGAVLVGVGKLGSALLSYQGFAECGLSIVAGFDTDESIIGCSVGGKQIFPMSKLPDICKRMNVKIGIITVPSPQAQAVCDTLIKSGIMALWNFAPAHLLTPDGVFVKNENMAYSLAVLSKHIEGTLCV